jgi:glycopeptide antibiotics resistance protein
MPVTWHRCRQPLTAFLTGLAAAITIELSQLAISLSVGVPYRIFDVDDIILNTLGVMLGWALWKAMAGLALPVGQSA